MLTSFVTIDLHVTLGCSKIRRRHVLKIPLSDGTSRGRLMDISERQDKETDKMAVEQTQIYRYEIFEKALFVGGRKTPWLWSASELCRPSDCRFLAK
jgi:hypothetical protein